MMSKKEMITRAEIEQDIINALKLPPKTAEASYKRMTIPCAIVACLLVIVEFLYPKFIFFVLLALIPILFIFSAIRHFRLRHKIEKVCMDDYDIITDVLSDKSEESYVVRGHKWHSQRVNNYTLRFENNESWRVPKDNYLWSEERPMSDFAIYQSSHRGDLFIVVIKRDTGKIAMAYHADGFEYKNKVIYLGRASHEKAYHTYVIGFFE